VTLQQSEKNNLFQYIAQHRCTINEFDFIFFRTRRSRNQSAAVPIKTERLGGYSILQSERTGDLDSNESKVFGFVIDTASNLDVYRQMSSYGQLNIYEAYYESCCYAYILEFFIKNEFCSELLQQLSQYNATEAGIYKECVLEIS
jgi:hypothetical protein